MLYLVGELCRRKGNFLLAVSYFRRYLQQEQGPVYLRQAAAKLAEMAGEKSDRALKMEEVLYDPSPEEESD